MLQKQLQLTLVDLVVEVAAEIAGRDAPNSGLGPRYAKRLDQSMQGIGMSGTEERDKSRRCWLVAFEKGVWCLFSLEKTVSVGPREVSSGWKRGSDTVTSGDGFWAGARGARSGDAGDGG